MNFEEKLNLGKMLISEDNYLKAFDVFCELAYEKKEDIELQNIALFLFQRIVDANYDFEPTTANEFLFRGVSKCHKREFEASNKDYDKALKLNPKLDIAYYNKGLNYGHMKRFDLAIIEIEKAIAMNPIGLYYNELAQDYFELKKFPECFRAHELAIEKSPKAASFWHTYGSHLSIFGNNVEALVKLKRAVELDPKFDQAKRALVFVQNLLNNES